MATSSESNVLYAPDGRKFETASQEEVVNLKARGYSETKPKGSSASGTKAASS